MFLAPLRAHSDQRHIYAREPQLYCYNTDIIPRPISQDRKDEQHNITSVIFT